MPITYNVKKDYLYKRGREEGVQKVAQKLLEEGMPIQKVSELTELPVRVVEKIAKNIKE